MIEFTAGAALGALGALAGTRLLRGQSAGPATRGAGVTSELLADPALGWLLRANGALGVWLTQLDPAEAAPHAERVVDAERLAVAQIAEADRRLERARDQEQGGSEPLEAGTFVFRAGGGVAVGLLLPKDAPSARVADAERDLGRLLEAVRRRPQVVAQAQAQAQDASFESVGSLGLRLAYQLERSLNTDVVVAVLYHEAARVIGVSGRADRRLLDTVLPAQSPLAEAAAGKVGQMLVAGDPLGGTMPDRRRRQGITLLVPIVAGVGGKPVGAVAIYLPTGEEPGGPARAELVEAIANAGPRLARALEGERTGHQANADPLTGLANRRGLDQALRRQDSHEGTLIRADLDLFKQLNEALGQPAGDAALVHFARVIREQVRVSDTAARIGGEEFAVWLPDATLDLGMRIAERIRIKLGTTPWDWNGRSWPVTASFGVAACPGTAPSIADLSAQADAALYVAKRGGRNRVEAAGPPA